MLFGLYNMSVYGSYITLLPPISLSMVISPEVIFRDEPDIRPDNPAFFYIRYPAGYQIALSDIR
jgi:hypothetical protein